MKRLLRRLMDMKEEYACMKLPTYPLTLTAAKRNESLLWDIGDALLKECPPDSKRRNNLTVVVDYLQTNGCIYSEQWLADLRIVAAAFPPKDRRLSFAFVVHQEAETPEMLEAIIKGTPKGTVVSSRYVRKIVDRIRDHQERATKGC